MGIPRQEYWIGLSFPSPEDLPDPRIKLESPALLTSPAWQADAFLTELPGMPIPIIYLYITYLYYILGFPGGSHGKESACNVGDPGSIPGSGRSPGEGNVFLPGESHGWRRLVGATVHGVAESDTT